MFEAVIEPKGIFSEAVTNVLLQEQNS